MKRIHAVFAALCMFTVALPFALSAGAGDTGAGEAPAVSAAEKTYQQKAAKLTDKDAKGWKGLADFCEAQLLLDHRIEALRKVLEAAPNDADAHRRLDEVKVGKEWLPCAEADAAAAKEHEAKGEVYYGKAWVFAKDREGPRAADRKQFGWEIQSRIDGKLCVVYSAASYVDTRAVATVIDNAAAGYAAIWGKYRKVKPFKPFNVFLFTKGEDLVSNYKRLVNTSANIPKGFAGVYDASVKAMFISTDIGLASWNTDELLRSVAHETSHAIDDLSAGMDPRTVPVWIAEGRAVYSQYSLVGRQWLAGAVTMGGRDARGKMLEKSYQTASLETLLGLEYVPFMKGDGKTGPEAHYGQAWSFVHFLMHGQNGKYRDRFIKFVAGCPQNSSIRDFEKTVAKTSELTEPYRAYVRDVLIPMAKASFTADAKARNLPVLWE